MIPKLRNVLRVKAQRNCCIDITYDTGLLCVGLIWSDVFIVLNI